MRKWFLRKKFMALGGVRKFVWLVGVEQVNLLSSLPWGCVFIVVLEEASSNLLAPLPYHHTLRGLRYGENRNNIRVK